MLCTGEGGGGFLLGTQGAIDVLGILIWSDDFLKEEGWGVTVATVLLVYCKSNFFRTGPVVCKY